MQILSIDMVKLKFKKLLCLIRLALWIIVLSSVGWAEDLYRLNREDVTRRFSQSRGVREVLCRAVLAKGTGTIRTGMNVTQRDKFMKEGLPLLADAAEKQGLKISQFIEELFTVIELYSSIVQYDKLFEKELSQMAFLVKQYSSRLDKLPNKRVIRGRGDIMATNLLVSALSSVEAIIQPIEEMGYKVLTNSPFPISHRRMASLLEGFQNVEDSLAQMENDLFQSEQSLNELNLEVAKGEAVDAVDAVEAVEELPASSSERQLELKSYIEGENELKPHQWYTYRGVDGIERQVNFKNKVFKSLKDNQELSRYLRKLVKSIPNGHGGLSGIKLLNDIGENLVEVKARTKGHIRLLGCLKGNQLTILDIKPLPSSRTGYFKVIDKGICRDAA